MSNGIFSISLDFELHWGVHDSRTLESYAKNLLGVRQAVPAMLQLFSEFGIHATWATVGFLFHRTHAELMANLPAKRPAYRNWSHSPYGLLEGIGPDEASDPYHYAPSLIQLIVNTPGQEIGTHTYSHFCCLEDGADTESFAEDLAAAKRAALRYGIRLRSIVFPRNQYTSAYLRVARQLGFDTFRGNPTSVLYRPRTSRQMNGTLLRGTHLVDTYVAISGSNVECVRPGSNGEPANVPASRFLRPYLERLKFLDDARLSRINKSMEIAARTGRLFHLWWHPHNFGVCLPENLAFLRRILAHYARMAREYKMQSLSMAEVTDWLAREAAEKVAVKGSTKCAV
jgi:peptidoglycan/xylan/chitin deacetylase (PgdA/CDA1 family)